ncbi:MAG: FCD domain-containing protein [Gammaproteobacteria bacterium]|nr:FCD domain-containing protein [Gammaproteobacteria bacterium]MBU2408931.1 FCD domain-containing protein [Gammaproteobacteria bacterium]
MNEIDSEPAGAEPKAAGAKALSRFLRDGMASGQLRSGFKLPAERELSEQFGASRGAVRRVLSTFRERGLITQTVGSGTFVSGVPEAVVVPDLLLSRSADSVSPAELMEARRLIEPLMPSLIARNATSADFAAMQNCIDKSEAAQSIREFEFWDGELHKALAAATHNAFFVQILELSQRIRDQGEWGRLKAKSLTPRRRTQYEQQHRALVDALRDRDAALAARLLIQHLDQIQKNLFDG